MWHEEVSFFLIYPQNKLVFKAFIEGQKWSDKDSQFSIHTTLEIVMLNSNPV